MGESAKEPNQSNFVNKRNYDGFKPKAIPIALKVIGGNRGALFFQEAAAMNEQKKNIKTKATFYDSFQVRIVSDFEKSLSWYRDVLGCEVDYWGHAIRGGMKLIIQQAKQPSDVMPNQTSEKRDNYPTDWKGPDLAWDTFIHINYDEFDSLLEELRTNEANIILGPIENTHSNGMTFKNIYIKDPDGYIIVFG
jgi:catechol 2,3-dioxygenase-like lactoylglutathione lyase family enzyme